MAKFLRTLLALQGVIGLVVFAVGLGLAFGFAWAMVGAGAVLLLGAYWTERR